MTGLLVRSRRQQETSQQAEVQSLQRVCGQNKGMKNFSDKWIVGADKRSRLTNQSLDDLLCVLSSKVPLKSLLTVGTYPATIGWYRDV